MDINEIEFFEGVDDQVIQKIESCCSEKTFNQGDTIFEKGEPADFLYFLVNGHIDLLLKEKEMSIFTLTRPGEVFGWSSMVENGIYTSSSVCRSRTSVLEIPRQDIKEIFNQHPLEAIAFYQRIGSVFSKRLSTVID